MLIKKQPAILSRMKIRTSINSALLAAALTATQSANAALSVQQGDLLLGFAKVNSSGTGYEGNTFVYNLGLASSYRDGAATPALPNLNVDLTAAFGSGWAGDSSVRWGVVGVVGSTSATIAGDPARTTYFSRDFLGSSRGSEPVTFSQNQRGALTINLEGFFSYMNGIAENGAASGGAFYSSSGINSFSSFLPPGPTTYFGIGVSPFAIFGGGDVSGVDLYRVLHATDGAALNAANDGPATVGAGQYIGTFTISDSGVVQFIPEPSAFLLAAIAALSGLAGRRRVSA